MKFLSTIPCLREKIYRKLESIKATTIWSGVIRSVSIAYMNWCISTVVFIESYRESWTIKHTIFLGIVNFYLIMIPIYAAYFGYVNREFMKGRVANMMYKPLVGDIGKNRSGLVSYFFSVFIIRRYVLIGLPLVFIQYPAIQI